MKIDFHVHTISNQYLDQNFDFDEEAMIAYVRNNSFDAIAITNHNLFNKEQFLEIVKQLKDEKCSIFPGIEISLEGGHILVIGDNTEVYIEKLVKISNFIRLDEKNDQYKMSVEQFNELIKQEDDFLIIPHYLKKPKISDDTLEKIKSKIFVGEVQGPKKFYAMKKEKRMTPVFFSDIRIKKATEKDFSTFYLNVSDYTYLKCDTCSFRSIKFALMNIDLTSLTDDFKGNLFEIMNGEAKASLGINVLLGKRSSGKTFTLDHIYGQGNQRTLYIRQFDIVKKCESENFDSFLQKNNDEIVISFLHEMNVLFDYINQFSPSEIENNLSEYLKSIKDSAEQNLEDSFSKVPLFKNDCLKEYENQALQIYEALDVLLSASKEYKERIFENVHQNTLKKLYAMFLSEAKKIYLANQLIKKTNDISDLIGKKLEKNSSKIRIKQIDFKKIFKLRYIKTKFNSLIGNIQKKQIIQKTLFNKFNVTLELVREKNKSKLKSNLKVPKSGNIDYLFTYSPYFAFFKAKQDDQINNKFGEDRYKIFFSISQKVTTINGLELSGGQKAEFVLLSKLDNYRSYDLILIDEMESSFDNPFLNNEIITQIKKMAKEAIIFISTHNNNLGVSLNPDFYIYHELQIDKNGRPVHKKFFGSPTSKKLESKDGGSVELSEVLITTMEANDKAYKERKEKYENS